jgi:DNA mismatch endonuclease (patch repair protein)
MDMFTKEERSALMARIRSTGTSPELRLYELVRGTLGDNCSVYQNVRSLPGCPDVLVPSLALAIFADGCFFHGCPRHSRTPKSNADYWGPKIARNASRDASRRRKLRALGLGVWRFWEHDLEGRQLEKTRVILERRLERRLPAAQELSLSLQVVDGMPHG